ncbi:SID1 transmembrane family member 1 [Nymphon striatum]|nr:SID1 transmembrane family member 1 [Nymphon striatum]
MSFLNILLSSFLLHTGYIFVHSIDYDQLRILTPIILKFGRLIKSNLSNNYIWNNNKINHFFYQTQAIRVNVNTSKVLSTTNIPVVFVVRQETGIMSWQLPLHVDRKSYYQVGRNICPLKNYGVTQTSVGWQDVFVDIASESKIEIDVSLKLDFMDHYILETDRLITFTTSPSEPKYFEYQFPADLDMVFVELRSPDSLCMTWSIQSPECPIYDLNVNFQHTGYFQTVSEKSAMTVKKSNFPKGFVLVFIVKEKDNECTAGNRVNMGRKASSSLN